MSAVPDSVRHLYLHAPFCRTRCPYCDYAVTAKDRPDPVRWLGAIGRELEARKGEQMLSTPLQTILVGGGTPSVLGAGVMEGLRAVLGPERLTGVEEWTAEANPEDLDAELARDWADAGVTRVNVGIQSMRTGALGWLGRAHRVEDGHRAAGIVRSSGFRTWSVDLLYGLPTSVDPDPLESVRAVVDLGAPHLSLYELVAEPGTPLGRQVASGRETVVDEDLKADQYLAIGAFLESEGYEAYEFTAFARSGHASKHARAVLEGAPYIGLGPGAHSDVGGWRSWNLRDWRGYVTAVESGHSATEGTERPGPSERLLERLWGGLRLGDGIPFDEVPGGARALAEQWAQSGLALPDSSRLRLTPEGWLRLEGLLRAILPPPDHGGSPDRRGSMGDE